MKKLLKSCKIGVISILIVVFLVACGKSAPSSMRHEYTHDANVGLKKKRSADLMDILSNMLLDHSGGVDSEWPNYGNIFDNDYPMDDWMANEIPQADYDNNFIDYNDRYIGNIDFSENVDLNPPDSLDYSCSEEENNDVVPFVESGYQYNRHPVKSNWNDRDFVVIKPGVEDTYRHRHDKEVEYGTNGDDLNRMPSRGNAEIDEMLWKQFGIQGQNKPPLSGAAPPVERSSPPVTNAIGKEVKFNIFKCLCGPHQPHHPEQEAKNTADEYMVLLIKKDHILGGKNENNAPRNRNDHTEHGTSTKTIAIPSKAEADTTERRTTTQSGVTIGPADEDNSNKTIATEIPLLSATHTTSVTEVPLSSTTKTMTVTATESPSIKKAHVLGASTSATERPSTVTNPVQPSTIVFTTTTTRHPSSTRSYIPSSMVTIKTTQSPPTFKISEPKVSVTERPSINAAGITKTTQSPPTFTISEPKVSVTERPTINAAGTTKTTQSPSTFTISEPNVSVTERPSIIAAGTTKTTESPPKFTISEPKVSVTERPSIIAAGTTKTTESPPKFTISEPKVSVTERSSIIAAGSTKTSQSPPTFTITEPKASVTERPSITAASTTEIPAATTNHFQNPSETTHSIPVTIVSATTKSPTSSTRPTPTTLKAVTTTEIPHSTTNHIPTRTTDPAPVIVGDSKYIATDGATTKFSKTTAATITTETISIATVISATGNENIGTTLLPTTHAQTTTEMPPLRTTQMDNHPTKLERIVQFGQQYSTIPPSDTNRDAQTTNTLEDINGNNHPVPTEKLVGHLIKLKRSLQQIQPTIEELLSHAEADQLP